MRRAALSPPDTRFPLAHNHRRLLGDDAAGADRFVGHLEASSAQFVGRKQRLFAWPLFDHGFEFGPRDFRQAKYASPFAAQVVEELGAIKIGKPAVRQCVLDHLNDLGHLGQFIVGHAAAFPRRASSMLGLALVQEGFIANPHERVAFPCVTAWLRDGKVERWGAVKKDDMPLY